MNQLRISALNPELPAAESTVFRAAVTLIWPYSSSARQLALLLAEPDFRLRRQKGQVRARFSGSSAKALATTGIGIGDEVVLSLRGAQFIQEGTVSTPGKSIDWELSYSQTVQVRIFRNGAEIANLDLIDVAPTPAPRSPVRHDPIHASARKWSSPAFLKRVRLSDGPFFEAPYDPLADEAEEGHDKKRRRKSYRDWKAWKYSARTPSPEKEGMDTEDDAELLEPSPSRPAQLPHTPVSPGEQEAPSVAAGLLERINHDDTVGELERQPENVVRDADYDELYAGPNEFPPGETQYAFGGDTEEDTEEDSELNVEESSNLEVEEYTEEVEEKIEPDAGKETDSDDERESEVDVEEEGEEEDAQSEPDIISLSPTEVNTEDLEGERLDPIEKDTSEVESSVSEQAIDRDFTHSTTEEDGSIEVLGEPQSEDAVVQVDGDGIDLQQISPEVPMRIAMPPPALTSLRTDFPPATASNLLTPIGREPASPTLQPLDSATLPLPSPFPGEAPDDTVSSYLDHVTTTQPTNAEAVIVEEEPVDDASYIMETSFFHSIHSNHETAFTPVRFTFGFDSASSSAVKESSTLEKQETSVVAEDKLPEPVESLDTFGADPSASENNEDMTALPSTEVHENMDANQAEGLVEVEMISNVVEISSDVEPEADSIEVVDHQASQAKSGENTTTETQTLHSEEESAFVDRNLLPEDHEIDNQIVMEASKGSTDVLESTDEEQVTLVTLKPSSIELHEDVIPETVDEAHPANTASFTDLTNSSLTTEFSNVISTLEEPAYGDIQFQQSMSYDFDQLAQSQLPNAEEPLPQSVAADPDVHMEDGKMQNDDAAKLLDLNFSDVLEPPEDMEIQETQEAYLSPNRHTDSLATDNLLNEPFIPASENDDRLKETRNTSLPPASPTKNTRSREKAVVFPDQEAPATRRKTRSHKSKASVTSVTSIARASISPPRTPIRSVFSPPHSASQTSPYRLRSHSKPISPSQAVSPASRRRSRKHMSQASIGSVSDIGTSQKESDHVLEASNEDSYSQSIQQAEPIEVRESNLRSKHPEFADQDTGIREGDVKQTDATDDDTIHLSIAQPTIDSSIEKLPSTRPTEITAPGSRNVRRTRRRVYGLSQEPEDPIQKISEHTVHRAQQEMQDRVNPEKRDKGHSFEEPVALSRTSSVINVEQGAHRISRTAAGVLPSRNEPFTLDNNHVITPEATQRSTTDSQPGFQIDQHRQPLPMTPQLTQTSSAGLQPLHHDVESSKESAKSPVKSPRVTKSTPRRNVTATDVASASASPKSPAASSTPEVAHEKPSIGLSTPSAYYTPLKDLMFYLNRSSQFHFAGNPDLLALVTSPTTPPQRATKGPKHWNTTLHITDLSSWPSTTTVNVFRAYQTALPQADAGDVVLFRAFAIKSLNRHPALISADESSWCVWRFGKPVWRGSKKGHASEQLNAVEETRGPSVEKGEGELQEVGRLRNWYTSTLKSELDQKEGSQMKTRSKDKTHDAAESQEASQVVEKTSETGRQTRSKDKSHDSAESQEAAQAVEEAHEEVGMHTRSKDKVQQDTKNHDLAESQEASQVVEEPHEEVGMHTRSKDKIQHNTENPEASQVTEKTTEEAGRRTRSKNQRSKVGGNPK